MTVGLVGSAALIEFERHLRERRRLLVLGVGVERRPGPRRHVRPAFLGSDEVEVSLTRRPGDELLRIGLLLRSGRDGERPRPQPVAALAEPGVGSQREADLVGDLGLLRIGDERRGDRGVDPHAALARLEQGEVLVEPVRGGARRARILHQVDIEIESRFPLRLVELRLPGLVEPARAEGVRHRREEGHVLAPAGLAAQADSVDLVRFVGDLAGRVGDEIPCRRIRHGKARLLEEVLAIHDHRALAVERCAIELPVNRQAAADRRQQVVDVVVAAEVVERHEPALFRPDRHFVGADRHDVVLAALGGDVRRDLLAEDILLHGHPFDVDFGILRLEVVRQLLHRDHVAVVDRGDGERFGARAGDQRQPQAGSGQEGSKLHMDPPLSKVEQLPWLWAITHPQARPVKSHFAGGQGCEQCSAGAQQGGCGAFVGDEAVDEAARRRRENSRKLPFSHGNSDDERAFA